MNPEEKQRVLRAYSERLARLGPTPSALGWNKGLQDIRFEALLSDFGQIQGSLLDFGCGFGDLLDYLKRRGVVIEYEGLDINRDLLEVARELHPDTTFYELDITATDLPRTYDFIVSSGVHNIRLNDPDAFLRRTMDAFFEASVVGFALNFLSARVDFRTESSHHHEPAAILELAYEYTNRVVLRNDYMPFEFTLIVFKDSRFAKDSPAYKDFISRNPRTA